MIRTILALLFVAVLLFGILPNFLKQPTSTAPTLVARKEVDIGATQEEVEKQMSAAMLDAHYKEARKNVPEDYPIVSIGECPYSKPMSKAFPPVDVPLCILQR